MQEAQADKCGQGWRQRAGEGDEGVGDQVADEQAALVGPRAKFSEQDQAEAAARDKGGQHQLGHRR